MVVCDRSRVRYGSGAQPNLETRASRTTNRDVISSTHVQYGSTADLVARWWNGQRDRSARRDIWLTSDGQVWNVRARQGGAGGREVVYDFTRAHEARAIVGRLIATAPGGWKDITKLVRRLVSPGGERLSQFWMNRTSHSGWRCCRE